MTPTPRWVVFGGQGAGGTRAGSRAQPRTHHNAEPCVGLPSGLDCHCVIVVYGEATRAPLEQMRALDRLGIAGLALGNTDRWVFGTALAARAEGARQGRHRDRQRTEHRSGERLPGAITAILARKMIRNRGP